MCLVRNLLQFQPPRDPIPIHVSHQPQPNLHSIIINLADPQTQQQQIRYSVCIPSRSLHTYRPHEEVEKNPVTTPQMKPNLSQAFVSTSPTTSATLPVSIPPRKCIQYMRLVLQQLGTLSLCPTEYCIHVRPRLHARQSALPV